MNILLTGATGYIGKRLLPILLESGHHICCCVRDRERFDTSPYGKEAITVIEIDFLNPSATTKIPENIDAAYYLIHSMSASSGDFEEMEQKAAQNFVGALRDTRVKQVIYLSGIVNSEHLSKHLRSRKDVEDVLASGPFHLTTLRAGIIVGSGSASFEIMRDLVEKLPVMVAPRWLNTRTQPIAISNVLSFLSGVLAKEFAYDKSFDIGGPDILTYREMLLRFAAVRGLKRKIFTVPVMTPRLSSYWLYFVTSTSYRLAVNLVNSMHVETVAEPNDLREKLGIPQMSYEDAVRIAFKKIESQEVLSSWKDAQSSDVLSGGISNLIQVPAHGCFKDQQIAPVGNEKETLDRIWSIGGENGWYYADWLWEVRGFLDKLVGGVGMRRGRRSQSHLTAGDALDCWRVLYANREEKRLLLYAEMKLPGEAWLEFRIRDKKLQQVATFRPLGVWGRLYWYAVLPFHELIFKGMIKRIVG